MLILRKLENNLKTTVFKKQTHTELYTKWDSYISYKYKQNFALTLLDRAFKIYRLSNYKLIHEEFQNIFVVLQKNVYQNSFLDKQISNYLNKKFSKQKILILNSFLWNNF